MYETTARDEVLVNYCSKQPNDMIDAKLLSNCLVQRTLRPIANVLNKPIRTTPINYQDF
jgi:hypothetical protein